MIRCSRAFPVRKFNKTIIQFTHADCCLLRLDVSVIRKYLGERQLQSPFIYVTNDTDTFRTGPLCISPVGERASCYKYYYN